MAAIASYRAAPMVAPEWGGRALLLGLAIFGLLLVIYIPFLHVYVPNNEDIPLLADGSLLGPGASWQHWFTQGYSHFWDGYPEWPWSPGTSFIRPAFQFLIYLAHFAFGTNWAWYQCINCFAVAGMGAAAFHVANTVLNLRTLPSLLACVLVVLSPPVVESRLLATVSAIEPLATLCVVGAFLAAVGRRDFICLVLLVLALLFKENAVWAPIAAAATIMLRPLPNESFARRTFTAAFMLLPIAVWLGFRFAVFGGVGNTYATAGYTPVVDFLRMSFHKLKQMNRLFVGYSWHSSGPDLLGQGTRLLVYMLLSVWTFHILREAVRYGRFVKQNWQWPTVDSLFLVNVWAAIALAFHFALPLYFERYATSLVVFAWPAIVAEAERLRRVTIWVCLAVCCAVSLVFAFSGYVEFIVNSPLPNDEKMMRAELRQVPPPIRQIYVLTADGIIYANFKYVRLILGVPAEVLRIADIDWYRCGSNDFVASNYTITDSIVNLTITLPACATFAFDHSSLRIDEAPLANGYFYRNETMSYEFPEAAPTVTSGQESSLGRRMIVHVRPNGPARFIIQHGEPKGLVRFDVR
jgi:hypothetical protein